ncbi:sodium-coupled monocarboxylate transporter 1 [Galendromus occidentalis]|uniref:Sodium-coupled monocarboxylate transporter 1 n=1 Tax=Galendromus occidentalis TaxID=34638 RepID=A0AAJ6QY25_9ACAR|nr:sodium-coupled monocarboxylate transporter 1 [Galendromus occidentalis]
MDFGAIAREELVGRFSLLDYGIFIAMLAMSGALGLYCAFNGGPQNTTRQLLVADGRLPPILASTSLMASFISASFILGNVAEVYQYGTMYMFTLLSYVITIPVTAHLFMPVFYNSGTLSCYEYLERRFNRTLRMLAVAAYIAQMLIYIAIQLYAPALALSNVTGMGIWTAVIAIGVVCTIYTSVGGIKAVVYTDTFQAVCMIIALMIIVVVGIDRVGGLAVVWDIAMKGGRIHFDETDPNPTVRHSIWGLVIGSSFSNLASYATNQMMVLRYHTVSSLPRAKLVVWGNLPLLAIVLMLSCFSGLMTYAFFHGCDPVATKLISSHDELLPYFVMVVLGETRGLPGVFAAGIFAASLSSISSAINSLANVCYMDIICLIWPKISNETGARIINALGVACGILSIVLVLFAQIMGDVLKATYVINSGLGGPLLGVFSVGMFLPFVNSKGATVGLLASLVVSLWLNVGSFLSLETVSPQLPISVEKCMNTYMSAMGMDTYVPPSAEQWTPPEHFAVHQISYLWYTPIATLVLLLVSVPVSFLTGANDPRTTDPRLIARPFDSLSPWLSQEVRDKLAFNVGADLEPKEKGAHGVMGTERPVFVPADVASHHIATVFDNEIFHQTRC